MDAGEDGGGPASATPTAADPPVAEVEPEPGPCTVFMGGIPGATPAAEFRTFVEKFGTVDAFKLVVKEGSRVGFAFVQYAVQETADRIKRSNTLHFRGRKLTIGDARRKPTPQPTTPDTTAVPAPAPADSSVATSVPTPAVAPAAGPAGTGVPAAALDVVANLEAAVQSFVEFVPPAEADPVEVPDAETASAVDAEHQDDQPQPASHHSVPIAEDAHVDVVASPPAASAGASTGQAGPEMPWPTAAAAPAAPPAGRGKRRRASEAAAPPPWPGPTGPTPAASDGSWAAAAMGPAGGAMDETTLQLAMSWYHTGYWTGYYAAKARRTRPAV